MVEERTLDPFALFEHWFGEAEQAEPSDPNAMSLATATPGGRPSARMVLLKGFDTDGFVFYTNLGSRKAEEILANPQVALCFHWKSLRRQVRIEGMAALVDDAEADAYFASRPRLSQIGAWASKQSQPLEGRFDLEARVARYTAKFGVGKVPRPPFWSGFRLVPDGFEFWEEKPFRLHARFRFERRDENWIRRELFP